MRLGVLGGTFDPPHIGHLILAEEARQQLQLERILFVLTPNPPHKQNQSVTPAHLRERMLRAALEGNPGFMVSTVDLQRPAPHYAVDTMSILRQEFPQASLIYLMGADSLRDLPHWHQPRVFVQRCDGIAILLRHGEEINLDELEQDLPGVTSKVMILDTPRVEVASQNIRQRIATGQTARYFLPDAVREIIRQEGLYLG